MQGRHPSPPKLSRSGLNIEVPSDTPPLSGDPTEASVAAPAGPPNSRRRSHWLPAARHACPRPATCHRVAVRWAARLARFQTCDASPNLLQDLSKPFSTSQPGTNILIMHTLVVNTSIAAT